MKPESVDNNLKKVISQRDKDRAYFLKNFLTLIEKYNHFVIFIHVEPDGDCLGSGFGLKDLIQTNFPYKRAYVVGDNFGLYSWLPMTFDNFINYSFDFSNSAAIIVDVGTSDRIQRFEKFFKGSKIRFGCVVKIDHHGAISDFHVDLSWDDPTYAATSCQIVQIADYYGWTMSPEASTFLYLGICTDSLRFSIEDALPRTLILGAKTWRSGADHAEVHRRLMKRTWKSIAADNYLLNKCNKTENVIWYYLTKKEIEEFEIFNPKGYVNVFQNIEDVWIWILFVEKDDGVVSAHFRSIHVSVRDLAFKFGGGGHENASGARIKYEQIDEIVKEAEKIVVEAKRKVEEEKERDIAEGTEEEMLLKTAPQVIERSREFLEKTMEEKKREEAEEENEEAA